MRITACLSLPAGSMAASGSRWLLYEGLMLPAVVHSAESISYAQHHFQVRPRDVFIVTYPKSGTTWMQELLTLIQCRGDPQLVRSVPPWERVPWVEHITAAGYLENRPCPRLISSHLPCNLFPTAIHGSSAKVPLFVGDLHWHRTSLPKPALLPVLFGSWFQHVKGWLGLRDRLNFLLLTYEELHQDLRGSVQRICQFLGEELDARALEAVVDNASFQAMKQNNMCNYSLVPEDIMDQRISPFLRKGSPGDWKGHFTVAQSQAFDQLYREQMQDVHVQFPWDQA
ncbi:sulfotransferase 2B1-like isoform X3 [Carettochelys insculpta]|uniref:sulfotransferase 2B1-like isoform X3 n=1 Tax=Carettochelys insculpta TaxID=44489 RepID=UPI003EB8FBC2